MAQHLRWHFVIAVLVVLMGVAAPGSAQRPEGPVLRPPGGAAPSPAMPTPSQPPVQQLDSRPALGCQTQWGICRVACCIPPGTPCYCQGPNNTALPGYAVQFFNPTQ